MASNHNRGGLDRKGLKGMIWAGTGAARASKRTNRPDWLKGFIGLAALSRLVPHGRVYDGRRIWSSTYSEVSAGTSAFAISRTSSRASGTPSRAVVRRPCRRCSEPRSKVECRVRHHGLSCCSIMQSNGPVSHPCPPWPDFRSGRDVLDRRQEFSIPCKRKRVPPGRAPGPARRDAPRRRPKIGLR